MTQNTGYDMQQYICPSEQASVYRLDTDETCHCKYDAQGYGRQYKNRAYEEIWADAQYVYRGVDTSSLPQDEVYAQWTTLPDGTLQYGAPWSPRHMNVGDIFARHPHVIHYRANGERFKEGDPVTYLRIKAHHATWTAKSGRLVNDVLELQYAFNPEFSSVKESYFYAREFGLVGFKDDQLESSITVDTPASVFPAIELAWFARPSAPPIVAPVPVPAPVPSPTGIPSPTESISMNHIVFIRGIPETPTITDVNVRSAPSLTADAKFRIPVNAQATCSEIKPDASGDNFLGQVYDWFFLTFGDGRQGWVRNDLLDLSGNFASLGYGFYSVRTFAFFAAQLLRMSGRPAAPPSTPSPAPPPAPMPAAPVGLVTAMGVCIATVRLDIPAAKVRSEPSRQSAERSSLFPGTQVSVREVSAPDAEGFRWVFVVALGIEGYVREDLLKYSAECIGLGLTPSAPPPIESPDPTRTNRYDPPVQVGFSINTRYLENGHKGIDLGLGTGTEVRASAKGVVIGIAQCIRCTPAQPSSIEQGFARNDSRVINNPDWGWGFGHAVLVRYGWEVLPQVARDKLTAVGRINFNAYIIYAHLSEANVAVQNSVSRGTLLGKSGNTGNSTGPHLHLEIRLSDVTDRFGFDSMFGFLVEDPAIFFRF